MDLYGALKGIYLRVRISLRSIRAFEPIVVEAGKRWLRKFTGLIHKKPLFYIAFKDRRYRRTRRNIYGNHKKTNRL